MKEIEYESAIRGLVFTFLAAPVVILLGMFVTGAFIDSFIKQENTFSLIFTGIGGISSIIAYYVREYKQFNQRSEQLHILKIRLAKGEITKKEYEEIREKLIE